MTRGNDESSLDLKKRIRKAYLDKSEGAEDMEEEFAPIIQWYLEMIGSQTAQKRLEGISMKQLVKLAGPFNNRVSLEATFLYAHV